MSIQKIKLVVGLIIWKTLNNPRYQNDKHSLECHIMVSKLGHHSWYIWILGSIMTACVHRKWINMKLSGTHLDVRKELPFGSWSLHIGSGVNARNLIFNNHLPTRINGFCAAFLTRWPITVRTTLKGNKTFTSLVRLILDGVVQTWLWSSKCSVDIV